MTYDVRYCYYLKETTNDQNFKHLGARSALDKVHLVTAFLKWSLYAKQIMRNLQSAGFLMKCLGR